MDGHPPKISCSTRCPSIHSLVFALASRLIRTSSPRFWRRETQKAFVFLPRSLKVVRWWSWLLGDISQESFLWKMSSGSAHSPMLFYLGERHPSMCFLQGIRSRSNSFSHWFLQAPVQSVSWLKIVPVSDKPESWGQRAIWDDLPSLSII